MFSLNWPFGRFSLNVAMSIWHCVCVSFSAFCKGDVGVKKSFYRHGKSTFYENNTSGFFLLTPKQQIKKIIQIKTIHCKILHAQSGWCGLKSQHFPVSPLTLSVTHTFRIFSDKSKKNIFIFLFIFAHHFFVQLQTYRFCWLDPDNFSSWKICF